MIKLNKQTVIFSMIILVLGYFLYKQYQDNRIKEKIIIQNELALNDTTRVLNKQWTTKYAIVKNLNIEKDSILKAKDETILNQQKLIITLRAISDSGIGTVVYDTLLAKEHYLFTNKNSFYRYEINVWSGEIPRYNFNLLFNPFELSVYLTRNVKGIWSGFGKVDSIANKYISISRLNVFVDRDDFARIETKTTRIDIGLGGNILLAPQVYLGIGVDVLVNLRNEFGYTYYLGKGYHELSYRQFFNVKR